jgi:hypothetical protein
LESRLKTTHEHIHDLEAFKEDGNKKVSQAKEDLEKSLNVTRDKTEHKQKEIERTRNEISSCFSVMSKIFSVFKSVPITPQLNKKFEMAWLDDLNEENIMNSLGYIEEFINYMIILLAFTQRDESPILGHNPLNSVCFEDPEESEGLQLKDLIDDKDLFEDREIDEYRNPIPLSELERKADLILKKSKFKL